MRRCRGLGDLPTATSAAGLTGITTNGSEGGPANPGESESTHARIGPVIAVGRQEPAGLQSGIDTSRADSWRQNIVTVDALPGV